MTAPQSSSVFWSPKKRKGSAMSRRAGGYDQNGNPGGLYTMSNPPPGKRFGAFVNGGKSIQWAPALVRLLSAPP
jgi:hypothetical protein